MKNLRNEFPILSQNTYLNTASSGLLHDSLLEFRHEHDLDFLIGGSRFRDSQQQFLDSVRNTIADFFNCTSGDTILVPNFSLGLNILLNDLDKNKNVLLLDNDYPSINFAVQNKGFEICYAHIDEQLEHNIKEALELHKPDVFIFSIVQYLSGIIIDLDFIKELKTKYPELLIIADGTQFCGTANFNFEESGIDIFGCSGYKWLLGGYGNGFLLFKKDILDKITPKLYKEISKKVNYDESYTNLKARFECGHLDTFNFGSLQLSLKYISKIGIDTIEKTIQDLSNHAKTELNKLNLLEESITKRTTHSSIFNLKGDQNLFDNLKKENIIVSLRGGGIRISMHFYNTAEDIDKLLSTLYRYR